MSYEVIFIFVGSSTISIDFLAFYSKSENKANVESGVKG